MSDEGKKERTTPLPAEEEQTLLPRRGDSEELQRSPLPKSPSSSALNTSEDESGPKTLETGAGTGAGPPAPGASKRALRLLNVSAGLDGCDDQMLPASFSAIEHELHFSPSKLGTVALCQSLSLSLSCPIWGYFADRSSHRVILSLGCGAWGAATIALAFAQSLNTIIALRSVAGVFMGSVAPVSQAMLVANNTRKNRGRIFGLIQASSNFGRIFGGFLATATGSHIILNVRGWRWCIGLVGVVSVALAGLLFLTLPPTTRTARERTLTPSDEAFLLTFGRGMPAAATGVGVSASPPPHNADEGDSYGGDRYGGEIHRIDRMPKDLPIGSFWKEVISKSLLRPSVGLIILEGCVGNIPWSALSFLTMYFQYCGMADWRAGLACSMMLFGGVAGGVFGGIAGDRLSRSSPYHGRPYLAQLSMLVRIPILYCLFNYIPPHPSSFLPSSFLAFALGLASFAGPAVSRPILSDTVLPEHRGTVFAVAVALEGVCSAVLGAPLVGRLAESLFHYHRPPAVAIADMDTALRERNSRALARALLLVTALPWVASSLIYACLHLTYRSDRRKVLLLGKQRSFAREGLYIPEDDPRVRSALSSTFETPLHPPLHPPPHTPPHTPPPSHHPPSPHPPSPHPPSPHPPSPHPPSPHPPSL